jgi:hypothetical protein
VKKAAAMSPDDIAVVPAQRLDTLVTDPPTGSERQRTDYAGTAWYGGRPEFLGNHPVPGRSCQLTAPFWLPDSHAYEPGAADQAIIQASAAVRGGQATSAGGNLHVLDVTAALGEDPQRGRAWFVFVTVAAVATLPFGVAYRVTVLSPSATLRPAGDV